MRHIELRHSFPLSLPGLSLKNIVPGVLLALLAPRYWPQNNRATC